MPRKVKKIVPPCKDMVLRGEEVPIEFCNTNCHFCDDPYACTIPHYLQHKYGIPHKE